MDEDRRGADHGPMLSPRTVRNLSAALAGMVVTALIILVKNLLT